jgi:hypothetical protein
MNTRTKDLFTARLLTGGALITAGALLTRQSAGLLHSIDLAHNWQPKDSCAKTELPIGRSGYAKLRDLL